MISIKNSKNIKDWFWMWYSWDERGYNFLAFDSKNILIKRTKSLDDHKRELSYFLDKFKDETII